MIEINIECDYEERIVALERTSAYQLGDVSLQRNWQKNVEGSIDLKFKNLADAILDKLEQLNKK